MARRNRSRKHQKARAPAYPTVSLSGDGEDILRYALANGAAQLLIAGVTRGSSGTAVTLIADVPVVVKDRKNYKVLDALVARIRDAAPGTTFDVLRDFKDIFRRASSDEAAFARSAIEFGLPGYGPRVRAAARNGTVDGSNPPFNLVTVTIDGVDIRTADESFIPAGTKTRALRKLIVELLESDEYKDLKTIVYSGDAVGIGHVATSNTAHEFGLDAEVFLAVPPGKENSSTLKLSRSLGAKVHMFQKSLSEIRDIADAFVAEDPKHRFRVWFGLDADHAIEVLAKQIRAAAEASGLSGENAPRRIYLPLGTGGTYKAFRRAFPETQFILLQVGKRFWPDLVEKGDMLFVHHLGLRQAYDGPVPMVTEGIGIGRELNSVDNFDTKMFDLIVRDKTFDPERDLFVNIAGSEFRQE